MKNVKVEKIPKARGASKMPSSEMNEEPVGVINQKNFGHVSKVATALHGSDPYVASHKL
jgi:hypothetical protein